MYYVYLIKSLSHLDKNYIGYTTNLEQRFEKHNSGATIYTALYRPWKLVMYMCFEEKVKAIEFEKYLKTGSGNAFAKRRLW